MYDEPLLEYHLGRPSVDRDLLLGLEDEATGELVAYYAFMPLLLLARGQLRKAVFGSFLTAAPSARRTGAARAVQLRLLDEAIGREYEEYLAFCEVGAVSNESIARSCASLGLRTRTVGTVSYLALPASALARRAGPASDRIRTYERTDARAAAVLPASRVPATIEARHDPRDLDHRFLAPVARTYVLPDHRGVAALAHFVLLEVRDRGRRFRNAYLRDFEGGRLDAPEVEQFLADVLRAVAGEGCHLLIAPATASAPVAQLSALGFRRTSQKLNLLLTPLRAGAEGTSASGDAAFSMDVY